MKQKVKQKYDVVIIGAGASALSAAALIVKEENKNVLVLEQHYLSGGYGISFKQNGEELDVALLHTEGLFEEIKELDKEKTIFFILESSPTIRQSEQRLMRMGFMKENILHK